MMPELTAAARRCYLLIRNDLFMNRFLLGISVATTAALMALAYFLGAARNLDPLPDVIFWIVGLYFFGWLAADKLFSNIHDGQKNLTWHMLPASLTEKYVSRLILAILGFTLAWSLVVWAVSFVSELATQFLYGRDHQVLDLFDGDFIREVYRFLILQSVMMFGVIYFKKNAAIKTSFTVVIYIIFHFLILIFLIKLLFRDCLGMETASLYFRDSNHTMLVKSSLNFFFAEALEKRRVWAVGMMENVFWYLLMPFFWMMGYVRLRELEV